MIESCCAHHLLYYLPAQYLSRALVLNILLGWLGVDRFYLGFPAVGLIKLFTLGGFLVGNVWDMAMLATGRLGRADGRALVVWRLGPRLVRATVSRATAIVVD